MKSNPYIPVKNTLAELQSCLVRVS